MLSPVRSTSGFRRNSPCRPHQLLVHRVTGSVPLHARTRLPSESTIAAGSPCSRLEWRPNAAVEDERRSRASYCLKLLRGPRSRTIRQAGSPPSSPPSIFFDPDVSPDRYVDNRGRHVVVADVFADQDARLPPASRRRPPFPRSRAFELRQHGLARKQWSNTLDGIAREDRARRRASDHGRSSTTNAHEPATAATDAATAARPPTAGPGRGMTRRSHPPRPAVLALRTGFSSARRSSFATVWHAIGRPIALLP